MSGEFDTRFFGRNLNFVIVLMVLSFILPIFTLYHLSLEGRPLSGKFDTINQKSQKGAVCEMLNSSHILTLFQAYELCYDYLGFM